MNRYLIIIAIVFGGFAAALAIAFSMLDLSPAPVVSSDGSLALPSGREVQFHEVIHSAPGTAGLAVRFRFTEADITQVKETVPYSEIEEDMRFICETYALERIANTGPQPAQVIISIADRAVPFGEASPDVTQIFEAYRPEDGACIWEGL
ncbi:MAG: DUF6497 family protein [Maritimibacter sp.]